MQCPVCGAANATDAESCFTCGRSLDALVQGHLLAGRYEIRRPLGKGGMGRVYEAFDRRLEEPVAIKVLRAELSWDPEASRRFLSEIKLARKVTHRNVCRIHEHSEEGSISFISMEYIAGTSLKEHLATRWPSLDEAYELVIQIAQGVAAIHEHGIVHRDLKSGNIMVDQNGVAKIVDFGIAKVIGAAGLTAGDKVFGTPEYMSPEQVEGSSVDGRSDVYALGCVTWEIFTGRPPFLGESPYATLLKHLKDPPPLEDLPGPLGVVLAKALAKAPIDRFQNVGEFLAALRTARGQDQTATGSAPKLALDGKTRVVKAPGTKTIVRAMEEAAPPSGRKPWVVAASALAALALGIGVYLVTQPEPAPIEVAAPPPVTTLAAVPTSTLPSEEVVIVPTAPPTTLASGRTARVPPTPPPTTLAAAVLPTPEPRPTPTPVSSTPVPAVAPTAPPPTTAPATTGTLALILVPDAEVILDGASIGIVGRRDLTLEAGSHALEIRHPDYLPLPRRVTIRAAQAQTLLIDLQEKGIPKVPRKK
jgi:serine/threonine-protein kinase